jgi:hypothetical protein
MHPLDAFRTDVGVKIGKIRHEIGKKAFESDRTRRIIQKRYQWGQRGSLFEILSLVTLQTSNHIILKELSKTFSRLLEERIFK